MNVIFAKDVLEDKKSWRKLDTCLDFFDEGRHLWEIDDVEFIQSSAWIQDNLDSHIGQENLDMLQKSYTSSLYSNVAHRLTITITLKQCDSIQNLTPQNALSCLTQPAYVIVENADSDRYFLETMMHAFKRDALCESYTNGWWEIESRGGATQIKNQIQAIQKKTKGPLRVFVLVDSDRLHPEHVNPAIQQLEKDCITEKIAYAILEKREIENYIPVEVLNDIPNKKEHVYKAFLELTQKQRDYYDMKKGFGKKIGQLFESKRDKFTKESIQGMCRDNPTELDDIFDKIEALI